MTLGVEIFTDHVTRVAVGCIIDTLAFFILDDLFFTLKRRIGDRIDHVAHAIRVDPEYLFQGIGGHDFVVNRSIGPGAAVAAATQFRDVFTVSAAWHIF